MTGAARGIGFGTAQALARRGAVVVVVDLDQTLRARGGPTPGRGLGFAADVTDRGAMQRVVATVVRGARRRRRGRRQRRRRVRGATVRAMNGEAFDRVLAVELGGVYNTVIAALDQVAARGGHIVVTSSVYAFLNGLGARAVRDGEGGRRAARARAAGRARPPRRERERRLLRLHRHRDGAPRGSTRTRSRPRCTNALPAVLHKRLSPAQAGEAIARGIEKRAPRIIAPKRWAALSALRGVINPLARRLGCSRTRACSRSCASSTRAAIRSSR